MNLNTYLKIAEKARLELSEQKQLEISAFDFQKALGAVFGYDAINSFRVKNLNQTSDEMVEKLKDYNFIKSEVIGSVTFYESIIPEGLPKTLNEEEIKHKGEIWIIHKNDKDPFPSDPHAHNEETGYKLHLGNGNLYTYKNKPLDEKISMKNLISIREKVKNITLPPLDSRKNNSTNV